MTCEIINVGTELLLGNILNTNAQFLSEQISHLGIDVFFQTIVGDNKSRLSEMIRLALTRCDLLIVTGGLGPTDDDITREVTAESVGLPLVFHQESYDRIVEHFKKRNMAPTNKKQAYIPENAIIMKNNNGTAPGFIIAKNNKHIAVLPGPPSELIPMFKESLVPYLSSLSDEIICSKFVKVFGLGESATEYKIKSLIESQTNPTIAPYAKETETHLRVTAKAKNENEAFYMINETVDKIENILTSGVFGYDNETMEGNLVKLLQEKKLTISFAESCTCGLLASKIGSVPGASEVLKESYITYSNESKNKILGVKKETIDNYTEYSEKTAVEMAEGLYKISGSDVCVSVTGIAGPGGGTPQKPVGTVYIGVYYKGKTFVKELLLRGNRDRIRNNAASHALNLIRLLLKGEEL